MEGSLAMAFCVDEFLAAVGRFSPRGEDGTRVLRRRLKPVCAFRIESAGPDVPAVDMTSLLSVGGDASGIPAALGLLAFVADVHEVSVMVPSDAAVADPQRRTLSDLLRPAGFHLLADGSGFVRLPCSLHAR